MYLYFKHRDESLSLVAKCDKKGVARHITKYINKLNPNYKIYYMRSWTTDNGDTVWYDVGSWSEFFILSKKELENG